MRDLITLKDQILRLKKSQAEEEDRKLTNMVTGILERELGQALWYGCSSTLVKLTTDTEFRKACRLLSEANYEYDPKERSREIVVWLEK